MGDRPLKVARRFLQGGVYKPLSEATPGEIDLLDTPVPPWLDREYPFVPPPGEDGTVSELRYLISLAPAREGNEEFIKGCDEDFRGYFRILCEELGTPYPEQEVSALIEDSAVLIAKLKWRYNRPRPYQMAAKFGIPFQPLDSKTAHSPAYPSGHAIQAHLVSSYLSETAPQHRQDFMDLAYDIGWSRVVAGYHWPSDVNYGRDVFRHIVMPSMPAAIRVAAKFKNKREVPKSNGEGTTIIYEYGPRQIAERNKAKAQRVETLRKNLDKLRAKVGGDLKSDDPHTRLTALAVALIDSTYERVGNDKSAKGGHHGVTTWQADHISFKGGKALIQYVGKSGVGQSKEVSGEASQALKRALEGKSGSDKVLCDGDDCTVLAKDVNAYLKPFGVTAKDMRGLHANEEMREALKRLRKEGPDLPTSRAEKDKLLKGEFKKALEIAAQVVGHESSTLKSQYLVPGLEETYLKSGDVLEQLSKAATKSQPQAEEEESERLVRKSPKKKPPRRDRERGRIQDEVDVDPDEKQDMKDTSNNYKDASFRVALKYVLSKVTKTDGGKYKAEKPGTDKAQYFEEKDQAEAWVKDEEGAEDQSLSDEDLEAHKEEKEEALKAQVSDLKDLVKGGILGAPQKLLDLVEKLEKFDVEDTNTLLTEKGQQIQDLGGKAAEFGNAKKEAESARKVLQDAKASPEEIGKALATVEHFEKVVDNPAVDTSNPIPSSASAPTTEKGKKKLKQEAAQRGVAAAAQYKDMPPEDRERHIKKLDGEISKLSQGDPKRVHLENKKRGIEVAATLNGEEVEGVTSTMSNLTSVADKGGNLDKVLAIPTTGSDSDIQHATREALSGMDSAQLGEVLGEDHPGAGIASHLTADLDEELAAELRQGVEDMAVAGTMTNADPSQVAPEGDLGGMLESGDSQGVVAWIKGFIEGLLGLGGSDKPDSDKPDSDKPDKPDSDKPDSDKPDLPELPESATEEVRKNKELLKGSKSDAEKKREFLQNADPETREKLKDLSPAEFMKVLSAIMDEEEVEL